MKRYLLPSLFVLSISALFTPQAEAQRYRYMDSSGNLHFVDSIGAIPREYRQQVVPPTPTPVLDNRQRMELQRAKEREAKEHQKKIENKKRETERMRRSIERSQKRVDGNSGSGLTSSQGNGSARDDIEVIR